MNKKIQDIYKLGQPNANDAIWPDYMQHGFDSSDVADLMHVITDDASEDEVGVWAPVYAWRILGQLKSPVAIEPLIAVFDKLEEDAWALNELPWVMGMIGASAIEPLSHHLNDFERPEMSRTIAMEGLAKIVIQHPSSRKTVIKHLRQYMDKPDIDAFSFNARLVLSIIDIKAIELMNEVRKMYEVGCIDDSSAGDLEEVEIKFGLRTKRSTPKPDYGMFAKTKESSTEAKVGRNDPCICGSGKKYKKCCLH